MYEVRWNFSENAAYRGSRPAELVIGSRYTGNINYYNKEGERVRTGPVYTVDESRDIQDYADTGMSTGKYFTAEDQASFRNSRSVSLKTTIPAGFTLSMLLKQLLPVRLRRSATAPFWLVSVKRKPPACTA